MTLAEKRQDRFDRASTDKFGDRRAELADAALATLGELGYARTSLREIAQHTVFSHGVLHYYFRDKNELITYCVRRYKEHCVTRYDDAVAQASSPAELAAGFSAALAQTLCDDREMHQLWYDLRAQALFSPELRETVVDLDSQLEAMIWRVVQRYAQLRGTEPSVPSTTAYGLFDGLFENALVRLVAGEQQGAIEQLKVGAGWLLDAVVGGR